MGEEQKPIGNEKNSSTVPTVREETIGDQVQHGINGERDLTFVEGDMVREPFARDIVHLEVVPDPEIDPKSPAGTIPERMHSTQEDISTHHAEDIAMHDADEREQNPPIIVES